MEAGTSSNHVEKPTRDNSYYQQKYLTLRRMTVQMIHENAALALEISTTEKKAASVRAERKYLLKKLLQYEKPDLQSMRATNKDSKLKKKKVKKSQPSKPANKSDGEGTSKAKMTNKNKSIPVQPIQVDSNSRPVFPIEIGALSVYSIGDIVHDRANYHTAHFIFPVGYCSTHSFSSSVNPEKQCLFTCKILDAGLCPRFEVSPEDDSSVVFASNSVVEVFTLFKNSMSSPDLKDFSDRLPKDAYDLFGLSQPVIQNLIQSLPGSRDCLKYEWKKFEVIRPMSHSASGSSKSRKQRMRQSDINIEALEKWARDQS